MNFFGIKASEFLKILEVKFKRDYKFYEKEKILNNFGFGNKIESIFLKVL